MNRVFIRKIRMFPNNKAFVMEDEEGDYNIFINDRIADNKLVEVLIHELMHISRGHLEDAVKTAKEMEEEINETRTKA